MTANASITPPAGPQYTPGASPTVQHSTPGEQFVRAFYAAWNAGGWPAVEPLIDERFEDHASPPAWRFGRAGFRAARLASAQVLRDVRITLTTLFSWTQSVQQVQPNVQGHPQEFVLAFADIHATFAGPLPLQGIPPSGGPITLPAWSLFRLAERPGLGLPADRSLVEHWELQNPHAVWLAVGGPAQVRPVLPTA